MLPVHPRLQGRRRRGPEAGGPGWRARRSGGAGQREVQRWAAVTAGRRGVDSRSAGRTATSGGGRSGTHGYRRSR